MKHILTYYHTRSLFTKNEFKPFVKKYFKNVRYLGVECGRSSPTIEVSNYEEVKDVLPKYAQPETAEIVIPENLTILEYLCYGLQAYKKRMVHYCK